MKKLSSPSGGFTLIELILVVTMLGVLGAVGLIYLNQKRQTQKSYVDRIISDFMSIEQGIILYSQDGTNPRDICRNTIQNADNLPTGYTDCNQSNTYPLFSQRQNALTNEGKYLFWPRPPLSGVFSDYVICCTLKDNKWRKSIRLIFDYSNSSAVNIAEEIKNKLPYEKVDVEYPSNTRDPARILYHVW